MGPFAQYVGQVLGRVHALFGDPPDSGLPTAVTAGNTLSRAGNLVRQAGGQVGAMSGVDGGAGPRAGRDDAETRRCKGI